MKALGLALAGILVLGPQPLVSQDSPWLFAPFAGTGERGYSGNAGPATMARLDHPNGLAVDARGNVYIADTGNHRIRRVRPDGTIGTFAGSNLFGDSGDGGPAIRASLNSPNGVAVDPEGNVYIADTGNHRIRRVDTDGVITTVAGKGRAGYSGDYGPATQARLNSPRALAVGPTGFLYIADAGNHRIRRVGTDGIIVTLAGTGRPGFSGDGQLASEARLHTPCDVVIGPGGILTIADFGNERVRRIGPQHRIETIAGTGIAGLAGDGGPSILARLSGPDGLALDSKGNLYIVDNGNRRICRVSPVGLITTILTASSPQAGTRKPDPRETLRSPVSVATDASGNVYVADNRGHVVFRSAPAPGGLLSSPGSAQPGDLGSGVTGPPGQTKEIR